MEMSSAAVDVDGDDAAILCSINHLFHGIMIRGLSDGGCACAETRTRGSSREGDFFIEKNFG